MDNVSENSMSKVPKVQKQSCNNNCTQKVNGKNRNDRTATTSSELSNLLARSLTFSIVRVEKECGAEIAANILRIVTDEHFNPTVLRNTASTLEECNTVMNEEIHFEKGGGN